MKRIISILLLFTIVLTGCGSTQVADVASELTEPVTITFWHVFSGDVEQALQEITDDFNKQNDMVTVELQTQQSYGNLETKLDAAQQSSTLPTLSIAYASWDELWSSYENISTYDTIKDYEMDFDNFVPAFLEEVKDEEGNILGLPYNKSTDVLFYNKDLVKQAGITTAPTSIEELFTDAKQITETTGVTGLGYDSLQNFLATLMIADDVSWINDSGDFQFTDSKVESDIKLYQDAINDGYARTKGEDDYFSDIMGSEKVAAYIGSSAGASYIDSAVNGKFDWGTIPLPFAATPQQGTNIVMYNTATPEEKLAAWEYLNYLYQDDNVVKFSLASGYMPATTSAINTEEYQQAMKDNEVVQATTDSIDKMQVSVPTFKGASEIFNNNMTNAMSKILDTNANIDDTLSTLCTEAQAIYERNK
ncbi:MAG: extracellular solute-binding protein [Mycoplasmatales bacterium]